VVQRRGGGYIHDAAPSTIYHSPDKCPACEVWTDQVDLDCFDPSVLITVFDEINRTKDARSVNENGWSSQATLDHLLGSLDGFGVSEIDRHNQGARSHGRDLLSGLFKACFAACEQSQHRAVLRKPYGNTPAQAAAGARDYRDLSA
jgi:hypothetical protein